MIGWILLAVVVALALAAPRYGADTRTGENWRPGDGARPVSGRHATVRGDLAGLARRVRVRVTGADVGGAGDHT